MTSEAQRWKALIRTSRCGRWLDVWWDFPLPHPSLSHGRGGGSGDSVTAGKQPVGTSSHWGGSRGDLSFASTCESRLTNPANFQDAIQCVGKTPGPYGIPNGAMKHLPPRVISLLVLFNAILRVQYFPPAWKHTRMISILKPGKDLALPSS
jgi:hypothetical protein